MRRRTQLIALLLVVTVAVATIPAIAITEVQSSPAPVVGAYRTPTLSAICIPTYPSRYQTYTVYGWLKWSGIPLPYKYVKVYYHFPGQSTWHYLKSVQTNVNGRYSFSSNSGAQAVYWMIKFAGDSVYYPKKGYITVKIGIPTTTVVWAPPVVGPDTIYNPGPRPGAQIPQGTDWWYCRAGLNAADGTHPCGIGRAMWYIDGKVAGGVWSYNKPGVNGLPGCSPGMGGGFAMLALHSADTRALSVGYHTLKCVYLGDNKYAPSTWVGRIYISPYVSPPR